MMGGGFGSVFHFPDLQMALLELRKLCVVSVLRKSSNSHLGVGGWHFYATAQTMPVGVRGAVAIVPLTRHTACLSRTLGDTESR